MSTFKLIAITPLAGCSSDYRKNLEIGRPYRFYNEYEIIVSANHSKIVSATRNNYDVPENLYELKNGINLSFSAVVGKNGTGKSTIFELLAYFVYILSTGKKIGDRPVLKTELDEIRQKHKFAVTDYNLLQEAIEYEKSGARTVTKDNEPIQKPISIAVDLLRKYDINFTKKKIVDENAIIISVKNHLHDNVIKSLYVDLHEQENWEKQLLKNFCISVLYETDGVIKEVSYTQSRFYYTIFNLGQKEKIDKFDEFDFESFFYNMYMNYSHHGLNSESIGPWINRLFHKNDAYTAPFVINPMRENGNFDINHELHLSKERLMANLLLELVQNGHISLLGKYKIKEFILSPKVLRSLPLFPLEGEDLEIFKSYTILKDVLKVFKSGEFIPYWDFALAYLERKINRIDKNYGFLIYKQDSNEIEREYQLNHFLANDTTHITKKIRQVINFLKVTSIAENKDFWQMQGNTVRANISPEKMLEWLELFKIDLLTLTPAELIEYGLPGFFKIDLLLSDEHGHAIAFSSLSSGEQQIILNSNSILYHLSNINSNHLKSTDNHRIKYNNVNIILDEVELYYHPEMQRQLIGELIQTFEKVRNKGVVGIKALNVCILTHSPFILSDIPSQNVLSLAENNQEEKQSKGTQTFGANIHDILIGKFFMESTTGEHVRTLIRELLDFYNIVRRAITNKEVVILKEHFEANKDKYIFLVENIGEDVVSGILRNHLDFITEKFENAT